MKKWGNSVIADLSEHWNKAHLRRMVRPLFFTAVIFYLCFHALSGERGIYALLRETRTLEALKAELAQVTAERVRMEHRAKLLSSSSLDLDLLDEQSRRVLGYSGEDEIVIFKPR